MSTPTTTQAPDGITAAVDVAIFHVISTLAIAMLSGQLRVEDLCMGTVLHRDECGGTKWPMSVCTCERILAFDTDRGLVRVAPDGAVVRTPLPNGSTRQQ